MLKSDGIDKKIQVNLARFEEIFVIFAATLESVCQIGFTQVDKQTANAELKAEKSKQLSR